MTAQPAFEEEPLGYRLALTISWSIYWRFWVLMGIGMVVTMVVTIVLSASPLGFVAALWIGALLSEILGIHIAIPLGIIANSNREKEWDRRSLELAIVKPDSVASARSGWVRTWDHCKMTLCFWLTVLIPVLHPINMFLFFPMLLQYRYKHFHLALVRAAKKQASAAASVSDSVQSIRECPTCGMRIWPTADGRCPSCGNVLTSA